MRAVRDRLVGKMAVEKACSHELNAEGSWDVDNKVRKVGWYQDVD